jgi:hypothetical protein
MRRGKGIDAIHPPEYAQVLAARITGAQFLELTPKSTDRSLYLQEFRAALSRFLSNLARTEGNTT